MRRPRVAVLTMTTWGPAYPRVSRWLASGLRELGVAADIVFLDAKPQGTGSGSTREVTLGLRRARWALPALIRYLRVTSPMVTIATPGSLGSLALVAGKLTGCAVVPWETSVPRLDAIDMTRQMRLVLRAAPFTYRTAPRVACVSEGVRQALIHELWPRLNPSRLVVIPNPIDADEVRRKSVPTAAPFRGLRICSTGRLLQAKGFDVLIDAMSIARSHLGTDWELLIIGEGPLRCALEGRVLRAGLEDHVHFVGYLDNPFPVMASADIIAQASRWEGFGIAMVEALCLGIPLVTTDCTGGLREVLRGGEFGVLVPPEDPQAFANALVALAEDGALRSRLHERGPDRAADFAPAVVGAQVVRLVDEIVEELGLGSRSPAR